MDASEIIDALALVPHPEGGWYRQTWRYPALPGVGSASVAADARDSGADSSERAEGTAIYFLLVAGERSHWHRVDADEVWHHYAGAPLELWMSATGERGELTMLGPDLLAGERPQAVIPAGVWQAASSRGDWTLCGCTVVPGFQFAGFDLAPPDWEPGRHPA